MYVGGMRLAAALALGLVARGAESGYETALALMERGRAAEAAGVLEKVVEETPADARSWKLKGVAHATMGEMEQADGAFERACRLAPKLEDACFYRVRSLYLLNRFEEALEWARRLEGDARTERLRALCLEALGRWKEAEAAYRRAVRAAARGEDARIDYGMALVRQGRAEEALGPLREAAREGRQAARAQRELGRALLQLDRLDEARAALEAAVTLDGNDAAARLALGRVLQRMGFAEEAARHLAAGASSAP